MALLAGCPSRAALSAENEGHWTLIVEDDSFQTSRPDTYSYADGDPAVAALVVVHNGSAPAVRVHHQGTGPALQLVADRDDRDSPVLDVESFSGRPAATLAGGPVIIGPDGTLVLRSVARVTAADTIEVARPTSIVLVEPAEGAQANVLSVPDVTEGQLLWVANDDDDPVFIGDVAVPPGETWSLLHVGGRFRALRNGS